MDPSTLLIELSSSKIGYGVYAPDGRATPTELLDQEDKGKLPLPTKDAVQGDVITQNQIIDRINAVKDAASALGISQYRIISTSAFRDGENASADGEAFAKKIEEETGLSVDILTGTEEAQCIASAVFNDPKVQSHAQSSNLLIDMGGRSTEFIASDAQGAITKIKSYPFGRLTPPDEAKKSAEEAIQDFTADIEKSECVIYSGSLFRASVAIFNESAQDNDHSLFRDFMQVSLHNDKLADTIQFPAPSVQVANALTSAIEENVQPATAITSSAKVPQGAIISQPERIKDIPQQQPPAYTLEMNL